MSRGRAELEAFARRWLAEHPERECPIVVPDWKPTYGESPAASALQDVRIAGALEALLADAGVTVLPPDGLVLVTGDADERPHAALCASTPAEECDTRRCEGCPGYAQWRAKVRAPYETGGWA